MLLVVFEFWYLLPKTYFPDDSFLPICIIVRFNELLKGQSKIDSDVYPSNLSLDEDQMPHERPATKTGKRLNLRNYLKPGWKDLFIGTLN